MKNVIGRLNPAIKGFEASCFDGVYITGDVSAADFAAIESQRLTQKDEEEASNSRLALQNQPD
jgi:amidophosphoribosyltransferase